MMSQTSTTAINPENYRFLQKYVHSHVGIVPDDSKEYLFQSRLASLVKQLSFGSINDLCAEMDSKRDVGVGHQIEAAMTTNEAYFFCDPAHYDAIRTMLPLMWREERRAKKSLRSWSAAASTGQEGYSLAMLLLEVELPSCDLQILGADFPSKVVERARCGMYRQIGVNRGLPASLLVKHFRHSSTDSQISDEVRKMARFETIDLRKTMHTLDRFDLSFCCNVMIYFDNQAKQSPLKELHRTLFRGGWLLLGGAETAFGVDEWFERKAVGSATVYVAR